MTENEMVGWHHQLDRHEFEQTLGDGEGQGSLVCRSPWGCKQLHTIEQLTHICKVPLEWEGPESNMTAVLV